MDRIEAMEVFVAAVEAGGFSAAARKIGRSAAAVTRAIAFLEERLGAELFRRTTRSIRLTEAGERYLVACRRILADLSETEARGADERAVPRGLISVTAPSLFGRLHVRPIVDRFVDSHPEVRARLALLDRVVNLIDEGFDVAVRIAHLPDSNLVATKVGEVRRVVCASPAYLARARRPRVPGDLQRNALFSFSPDGWSFREEGRTRRLKIHPRVASNSADAAIASAIEGRGITAALSYQVEAEIASGRLVRLLPSFEMPPVPVHVVAPAASVGSAKVRAFLDLVVPDLRLALAKRR